MDEEKKKEEPKKVKKEKKPVTFKTLIIRRIIFIVIFALIAAGVTAYFVIANPFEKEEEKKLSKEELFDNEVAKREHRNHVTLLNYNTDTFNLNDLKVTEHAENYEGYDITYFQIDGLKDNSIQIKINTNLKKDLEDAITKAKNDGNIKGEFNVWSYNSSSFANTLSIAYTLHSYVYNQYTYEETYSWEDYVLENYDLTTGKKIKIQDIFTSDTLGSDIFDSSFYSEFVSSHTEQEFSEENWEYRITNYKDVEEAILNLIMDFNDGKEIPFYFDEQKVTLLGNYARIFYDEHLDFIAVYNHFKTSKSIFTGEYYHLHNLPVLTKRYPSYYQIVDESDHYYIDVSLADFYYQDAERQEIMERLSHSVIDYINDEVRNMKQEATDSGKFIIYNYSYSLSENTSWTYYNNEYTPDGTYTLNISKAKMETTKSLYNSEIKERIQNAFRKAARIEGGDVRLYNNQFYYYIYDEDYDYDKMQQEWEISYDTDLYLDRVGNIFETKHEALMSVIWGDGD